MEDPLFKCLECGAAVPVLLGSLGRLCWFRCRDCGIEFSVEKKTLGEHGFVHRDYPRHTDDDD